MRLSRWLAAAGLAIAASVGITAALAEAPAGSRNFTTPPIVPNYFSNEGGPVMRQPGTLPAETAPAPVIVTPASRAAEARVPAAERTPGRHAVASRVRHHAVASSARPAHRTIAAFAPVRSPKTVVVKTSGPRKVRLARAQLHLAKSRQAAARGRHARRG